MAKAPKDDKYQGPGRVANTVGKAIFDGATLGALGATVGAISGYVFKGKLTPGKAAAINLEVGAKLGALVGVVSGAIAGWRQTGRAKAYFEERQQLKAENAELKQTISGVENAVGRKDGKSWGAAIREEAAEAEIAR